MLHLNLPLDAPLSFLSAGQFLAQGRPTHPRRRLDSHVLLIGRSGKYPIAQEGREYLLTENTFLLLPATLEHGGFAPASEGQSHFWCHFCAPGCTFSDAPSTGADILSLPEFGHIAHRERYALLFRQLIDAAYRTHADPAAGACVCNHYLAILLIELADDCRREQAGLSSGKGLLLVSQVEEWIRQHAPEGIRPADVAAHFRYNSDYLSQLMRTVAGVSLSEAIGRRRMAEARHLLMETDLGVGEIARLSGFQDSKYFMRAFRRAEGMTPTEYRQTLHRIHINIK